MMSRCFNVICRMATVDRLDVTVDRVDVTEVIKKWALKLLDKHVRVGERQVNESGRRFSLS